MENQQQTHPLVVDRELLNAELATRFAKADIDSSLAFQTRGRLILDGMTEIRGAMASSQIDSQRDAKANDVPIKGMFDREQDINQLKTKYGQLLDIFVRFVGQVDPARLK